MDAENSSQASAAPRRSLRRRLLRWAFGILGSIVVLLAIALGALRLMLAQVPEYRDQIQAWVNDTTKLDFRFRTLDARWRVFGPEIYVTDAEVFAPNGGPQLVRAKAASIGVDLARILFRAELLSGRIRLIEPEISLVRTLDGRVELEGQAALDPRDRNRFGVDDLPTGLLDIVDARVRFRDLKREMGPLRLDGVDLSVERDRNDVALEGEVELPARLGRRLEFAGEAQGRLDEPETLEWSFTVDARELQLAGWRDFFGALIHAPTAGQGDLRLHAGLTGLRLDSGALDLKLEDVALAGTQASQPPARFRTVAGRFEFQADARERRLTGKHIEFSTPARRWQPTDASFSWSFEGDLLTRLDAQAGYLLLENLLPIAAIAPQAPWRERALAMSPAGEIRNLRASYVRAAGGTHELTATAALRGVGFEPYEEIPGLRGLDGELSLTPSSGRLGVDSKGLLFVQPHVFRAPLAADVARGQVLWNRTADGWRIATREFEVRNPHVKAVADAELLMPTDEERSPVLNLHTKFSDVVLAEGWRYLPVNKLHGKTLQWLDAAFLSGRAPSGEFVFDGATRDFPFRDGQGEFRVSFPVAGLRLHYAEGWPDVENLAADIEFRNQGLTGRVHSGVLNGLRVGEGTAQFVDFKTGELTIKARAGGDLGEALGYLQKSPVGEVLGRKFMALRGSGSGGFAVDLMLPVLDMQRRHVDVLAKLDDANVALEGTKHAIAGLTGGFHLRDREVSMPDGLIGTYLGGAIRIDAAPETAAGRSDNVIRVRAVTPATALVAALEAPNAVRLGGTVDWRGVARLPLEPVDQRRPVRVPNVRIESSLRGTSVDLPVPFNKTAGTTQPLRIDVQWPSAAEALVRASFGSDVRTYLRIVAQGDAWRFARGALRFGEGEASLPAADGLEIRGALDALDLSEWFGLGGGSARAGPDRRPISDYLRSADLSVRTLELFGFEFPNVSASLLAGARTWSVNVDSPRARGTLLVPYDFAASEPLLLNMTRLSIGDPEAFATPPGERAAASAEQEPDPRHWPSVRASIGQLEAWGKKLGFVRAELVRVPEGLKLVSFAAQSPSFAANGDGSWLVQPDGAHGAFKFKLESTDVLQTLQDLGYGGALTGKRGLVDADLGWKGAPDATLASRLVGTLRVEMEDGQLLSVQPGAGRVFGLMSVAALPRRLSLDFSDFLRKGLGYDSIRGDFELREGDAYTSNLLLKGPAAEIGIVGRTGLDKRDYDQTAVVTGSVGNSLPVVGALAGGPVLGAAVLLFSQVFKEPLKGIARGYYRITGPWDNPNVVRVDRAEGKRAEGEVRTAEGAGNAGAN